MNTFIKNNKNLQFTFKLIEILTLYLLRLEKDRNHNGKKTWIHVETKN